MKIALLQFAPVWEEKEENKKKIISLLQCSAQYDVLIFPEMTLTGFTMSAEKFAEGTGGESFRFFSSIAIEKNCDVLAGIIERGKRRSYNTLLHITSKGRLNKIYRKIHPFSYSNENKFYEAGNRPAITKIKNHQIGLSICYDLRFPELYRHYGKKRVHLIVDIANWPDTRIEHWRTLLKARAIENQCYAAGVNRVGDDPKLRYNGFSSVFDPMGNEIVAVENEERLITAEIDKNFIREVREKFPFLDDMKMV